MTCRVFWRFSCPCSVHRCSSNSSSMYTVLLTSVPFLRTHFFTREPSEPYKSRASSDG